MKTFLFPVGIFALCAGFVAGKKENRRKRFYLEDPPLPSICPANPSEEQKIPLNVIEAKKEQFEQNGGTVLYYDYTDDTCDINGDGECTPYDIVEQIQSLDWEPYPTPDYEFDDNGMSRTPPEPYPFRTALPVMAGLRCNDNQKPYAVFIPNTYEDAAEAIKLITAYDEEFVIISGGHDYECQSSTTKALIITSLLNKIEYDFDPANPTVSAGAGVMWSNIYDGLKGMDSTYGVMGAQCGLVSVSGYTAGGGYSWHMSRYYGISAENVLEVKVALADGNIVTATTDNQYRDLRWALCGSGGQNLGLVLEWKFRLFNGPTGGFTHSRIEYRFDDQDEITYDEDGRRIYPWYMTRELLKCAVEAADPLLDEDAIGTVQVRYRKYRGDSNKQYSLEINTPCKNEGAVASVEESCLADKQYKSLVKLKKYHPPFRVRYEYYPTLPDFLLRRTNSYPSSRNTGSPSHFISGSLSTLGRLIDKSLDYFDPSYDAEQDPSKITSYFADFNWYGLKDIIKKPYLTSINSEAHKASWHVTTRAAYSDTETLYFPIQCYIRGWNWLVENVMGDDCYHGSYINYLDGTADKSAYYGRNLEPLLKIKKKYDPDNVFKRVKGIAMNDVDDDCLDDICRSF